MGNQTTEKTGLKYLLAAMGPGMILAATSIGPGSIVSFTNAGATYGYTLCWWTVLILVFRAVFTYAMNKYTVVTGKAVMVGIRDNYGRVWAIIAGLFAFVGPCVYAIGNCTGVGLAFTILFPGMPLKVGIIISVVICVALYSLKNLYQKIEVFMKLLVGIMVVIFIASFIGTLGIPYDGTVSHSLVGMPEGSMTIMLSLLGTTASLGTVVYGSSLAKEKGYTLADIKKGGMTMDIISGVVVIGVVSLACLFVGANLLPASPIKNGMDLANALAGLLGAFIRPLFGIAFLSAALSSMLMSPKVGINLLLQAMNKESGIENKTENIISIIIILFGVIIAFSYGGAPAQLLTLAQIGGVVSTPIFGIMTILLLNNKKEMKNYRIGLACNVALVISYIVVMITVINNLLTIIRTFMA